MQTYLLLVLWVILVLVAVWLSFALIAYAMTWGRERQEHPDPFKEWVWRLAPVLAGVLLIASASGAFHLYRHLADTAPYVLQEFTAWYLFGLVSRVLLLFYRRELFDRVCATDWHELWGALFVAVFGPPVLVHTCYRMWVERNRIWP